MLRAIHASVAARLGRDAPARRGAGELTRSARQAAELIAAIQTVGATVADAMGVETGEILATRAVQLVGAVLAVAARVAAVGDVNRLYVGLLDFQNRSRGHRARIYFEI